MTPLLLQSLEEARSSLSGEQAKSLKLEAQLAEANSKLGKVREEERGRQRASKQASNRNRSP